MLPNVAGLVDLLGRIAAEAAAADGAEPEAAARERRAADRAEGERDDDRPTIANRVRLARIAIPMPMTNSGQSRQASASRVEVERAGADQERDRPERNEQQAPEQEAASNAHRVHRPNLCVVGAPMGSWRSHASTWPDHGR